MIDLLNKKLSDLKAMRNQIALQLAKDEQRQADFAQNPPSPTIRRIVTRSIKFWTSLDKAYAPELDRIEKSLKEYKAQLEAGIIEDD